MYVFWAASQTAQRIFYKKSKRAIHPTGKPAGFLALNYNPIRYSNLLPCIAHKNKKAGKSRQKTKSTFCIRPGKPAARADTPKALENTPRLRLHGHKSAQIQAAKVKFFAAWICALKIGINIALQGMC